MKKLRLAALLLSLSLACGSTGAPSAPGTPSREFQKLRAEGMKITGENGKEVHLWGFNLGNWLLVEPWMLHLDAAPGVQAGKDIFDKLEARFGAEKGSELYRAYIDNFMQESDMAYLASLGVNFVRVPFWYAAVFDPKYAGTEFEPLDRVIGWAKKHGVYVLIDLHGAPGGQSTGVNILGENISNKFWGDRKYIDLTVKMWEKIAARYKDEKAVAGYDLLNEAWGASSIDELVGVYDELYKAIRAIDPDHMIFIEDALKGLHRLPHPSEKGWANVVYSFHYYPGFGGGKADPDEYMEKLPNLRRAQLYFGVPFHCGEFNSMGLDRGGVAYLHRYMEVFRRYGWAWNIWNYKKIEQNRDYNWGLVGNVDAWRPIDLEAAAFEEILDRFRGFATDKLAKNFAMEGILREYAQTLASGRWDPSGPTDLVLTPDEASFRRSSTGKLSIEWGMPSANFGYWGMEDAAHWSVEIPEDGLYGVEMDFSSGGKDPTVDLVIDGVKTGNSFVVANTGGWGNYQRGLLGLVKLTRGRHRVALVGSKVSDGVMNLRSVTLTKAGSVGKTLDPDYGRLDLSPLDFTRLDRKSLSGIGVEWQNTPGNLGNWRDGEAAVWEFSTDRDAEYDMTFLFSSPKPGSRMEIVVNGASVRTVDLPETGDWHRYTEVSCGSIAMKAGKNELLLKAMTSSPEGLGNVGRIRLQRRGA